MAPTTPSLAQPAPQPSASPPQTVVVSARAPQPLASVLADVSVVDRDEIARSGAVDVADVLARLPGIDFARSGGPGSATGVFVRGAESRHVAVFIDGVRVDAQGTGGAAWESIALDGVERIEVLRGPAAAVYGSDAIAGVVQIFTRGGAGVPSAPGWRPDASLKLGSYGTRQAGAGVTGRLGEVDVALGASAGRSRGFDAQPGVGEPDADGWRRRSASARLGWAPAAGHALDASASVSRLDARYDGFTPGADDVTHHDLRTLALGWRARWSDAATTRMQLGASRATLELTPDPYRTVTRVGSALLQHEQRLSPGQVLTAAAERRVDRLDNDANAFSPALSSRREQLALALGWRGDVEPSAARGVGWQLQVRHDRDSDFGGFTTGSAALGVALAPGWRAHASLASSFRAPTLYQRFSEYGVPGLQPERGRSAEAGVRWLSADALGEAGAVVWRQRIADLIGFDAPGPCASAFGCYANTGRAAIDGVTLSAKQRWGAFALRGSLDFHDPRDLATGEVLSRRAKRFATFGADVDVAGWRLGTALRAVGSRVDRATFPQPTRLGGYALVDVVAGRDVVPGLALELRVDNAGDKRYEQAAGYATAGRTVQVALRWDGR